MLDPGGVRPLAYVCMLKVRMREEESESRYNIYFTERERRGIEQFFSRLGTADHRRRGARAMPMGEGEGHYFVRCFIIISGRKIINGSRKGRCSLLNRRNDMLAKYFFCCRILIQLMPAELEQNHSQLCHT